MLSLRVDVGSHADARRTLAGARCTHRTGLQVSCCALACVSVATHAFCRVSPAHANMCVFVCIHTCVHSPQACSEHGEATRTGRLRPLAKAAGKRGCHTGDGDVGCTC